MMARYKHVVAQYYLGCSGSCNGCPHDRMHEGIRTCTHPLWKGKSIHDAITKLIGESIQAHLEENMPRILAVINHLLKGGE